MDPAGLANLQPQGQRGLYMALWQSRGRKVRLINRLKPKLVQIIRKKSGFTASKTFHVSMTTIMFDTYGYHDRECFDFLPGYGAV
jgi:hypothetical protein